VARKRYGCLTPWQKDPATYGHAVLTRGYRDCEQLVVEQCRELLENRLRYAEQDGESFLDAHGSRSKAIVWAHNSHIGDARYTEMGAVREELNIGQLCREHFDDEVALIGFDTHTGTVAAASDWGGDLEIKKVRPAHRDSYERVCHDAAIPHFLLDLHRDEALRRALLESRLERFIGVIYSPETELLSHYAQASLSRQFDAFVWFDETTAVTPLGPEHARPGVPETYPFGL
jgi:erythromycin esterase-like protein